MLCDILLKFSMRLRRRRSAYAYACAIRARASVDVFIKSFNRLFANTGKRLPVHRAPFPAAQPLKPSASVLIICSVPQHQTASWSDTYIAQTRIRLHSTNNSCRRIT